MYERAKFRKLLREKFSDEEITTICFDYFQDVYRRFTLSMTKDEKIRLLLETCEYQAVTDDLIGIVHSERPDIALENIENDKYKDSPTFVSLRQKSAVYYIKNKTQDIEIQEKDISNIRSDMIKSDNLAKEQFINQIVAIQKEIIKLHNEREDFEIIDEFEKELNLLKNKKMFMRILEFAEMLL